MSKLFLVRQFPSVLSLLLSLLAFLFVCSFTSAFPLGPSFPSKIENITLDSSLPGSVTSINNILNSNESSNIILNVEGYLCSTCKLKIGPNINVTSIFVNIAIEHQTGSGEIELFGHEPSTATSVDGGETLSSTFTSGNLAIYLNHNNHRYCPASASSNPIPNVVSSSSSSSTTAAPMMIKISNIHIRGKSSTFALRNHNSLPTSTDSTYNMIQRELRVNTQALFDLRLGSCASVATDYNNDEVNNNNNDNNNKILPFNISITHSTFNYFDDLDIAYHRNLIAPHSCSAFYGSTNSSRVTIQQLHVEESNFLSSGVPGGDPFKFQGSQKDGQVAGLWFDWSVSPEELGRVGNFEANFDRMWEKFGVFGESSIKRARIPGGGDDNVFVFKKSRFETPARAQSSLTALGLIEFSGHVVAAEDDNNNKNLPSLSITNCTVFQYGMNEGSAGQGIRLTLFNFNNIILDSNNITSPGIDSLTNNNWIGGTLARGVYLHLRNVTGLVSARHCYFDASGLFPYSIVFFDVGSCHNVRSVVVSNMTGQFRSTQITPVPVGTYRFIVVRFSSFIYSRGGRISAEVAANDTDVVSLHQSLEVAHLNITFFSENGHGLSVVDFSNIVCVGFRTIHFHDFNILNQGLPTASILAANNTWQPSPSISPDQFANITFERIRMKIVGRLFSASMFIMNIENVDTIAVVDCVADFNESSATVNPGGVNTGAGFSQTSASILLLTGITLGAHQHAHPVQRQAVLILRRNIFSVPRLMLQGLMALVPSSGQDRGFLFGLQTINVQLPRLIVSTDIIFDSNSFHILEPPSVVLFALRPTVVGILDTTFDNSRIWIRNETWVNEVESDSLLLFILSISIFPGDYSRGTVNTATTTFDFDCPASTINYKRITKGVKIADNAIPDTNLDYRVISGNIKTGLKRCIGPGTMTTSKSKSVSKDLTFTMPKTRTSRTATFSHQRFFCSPASYVTCDIARRRRSSPSTAKGLHFRSDTKIECTIHAQPDDDVLFKDSSMTRDRFRRVNEPPTLPQRRLSQFSDFGLRIFHAKGDTNGQQLVEQLPQQNIWVTAANVSSSGLSVLIELTIGPQKYDPDLDVVVDVQFLPSAFECEPPNVRINNNITMKMMQLYNNISSVVFPRSFASIPIVISQTITSIGASSIAVSSVLSGGISPGALALQRMVHIQDMFVSCSGAYEPFEILDSPFQMAIGSEESPARYALGAVVGNAVLNLSVLILCFIVAAYRSQVVKNVKMMKSSNLDAARIPAAFLVSSTILLCGSTVGFLRVMQLSSSGLEIAVAVILYFSLSLTGTYIIVRVLLPPRRFWSNVRFQNPNPDLLPENIEKEEFKIIQKQFEKVGKLHEFESKMKNIQQIKERSKKMREQLTKHFEIQKKRLFDEDENQHDDDDDTAPLLVTDENEEMMVVDNKSPQQMTKKKEKKNDENTTTVNKKKKKNYQSKEIKEAESRHKQAIKKCIEDENHLVREELSSGETGNAILNCSSTKWRLRLRNLQRYLFYSHVKWISKKKGSMFVSRFGPSIFDDCHPDVFYAHLVDVLLTILISICEGIEISSSSSSTSTSNACDTISFFICFLIVCSFGFTLIMSPWNFRHQTMIALSITGLSTASVLIICVERFFFMNNKNDGDDEEGGASASSSSSTIAQIIFLMAMTIGFYDALVNAFDMVGDAFLSNKPNSKLGRMLRQWFGGDDAKEEGTEGRKGGTITTSTSNATTTTINNNNKSLSGMQKLAQTIIKIDSNRQFQAATTAATGFFNADDHVHHNSPSSSSFSSPEAALLQRDPKLKGKTKAQIDLILQQRRAVRAAMERELGLHDDNDDRKDLLTKSSAIGGIVPSSRSPSAAIFGSPSTSLSFVHGSNTRILRQQQQQQLNRSPSSNHDHYHHHHHHHHHSSMSRSRHAVVDDTANYDHKRSRSRRSHRYNDDDDDERPTTSIKRRSRRETSQSESHHNRQQQKLLPEEREELLQSIVDGAKINSSSSHRNRSVGSSSNKGRETNHQTTTTSSSSLSKRQNSDLRLILSDARNRRRFEEI